MQPPASKDEEMQMPISDEQSCSGIDSSFNMIASMTTKLDDMLIAKGYSSVDGQLSITANGRGHPRYHASFWLKPYDYSWTQEQRTNMIRSLLLSKLDKESYDEFWLRIYEAVQAYPDALSEERKAVQKKLAELIEQAREANLDVSFVNPLIEMAAALSKNALTFQPLIEEFIMPLDFVGEPETPPEDFYKNLPADNDDDDIPF